MWGPPALYWSGFKKYDRTFHPSDAPVPSGAPLPRLTRAPGNGADIGGLKVTTENGWFAERPSGTEDVYKIYAESFRDDAHLQQVVDEAKAIVAEAFTRG